MSTTIASTIKTPSFDSILIQKPSDNSVIRLESHTNIKVCARYNIDPFPDSPRDRKYWRDMKNLFCKDFDHGMNMYRDMKSGTTKTYDDTASGVIVTEANGFWFAFHINTRYYTVLI